MPRNARSGSESRRVASLVNERVYSHAINRWARAAFGHFLHIDRSEEHTSELQSHFFPTRRSSDLIILAIHANPQLSIRAVNTLITAASARIGQCREMREVDPNPVGSLPS